MSLKPEEICKIVCGNEDTTINCIYPLSCGLVESCQKIANHYETAIIPAKIKEERQRLIKEIENIVNHCNAGNCKCSSMDCDNFNVTDYCNAWQQLKQENK